MCMIVCVYERFCFRFNFRFTPPPFVCPIIIILSMHHHPLSIRSGPISAIETPLGQERFRFREGPRHDRAPERVLSSARLLSRLLFDLREEVFTWEQDRTAIFCGGIERWGSEGARRAPVYNTSPRTGRSVVCNPLSSLLSVSSL